MSGSRRWGRCAISTERQYDLRNGAVEMMWAPERIRIPDQDLGQSGAQTTNREDFKTLVADVSLGRVGAIFALEASRLARSNLEWHRLIEICVLTRTLVIDEDGCYDPADFNDALLLGLKATIAQAELHVIRARLQGGKLHKAQKGELRFPLPIGLCYADEGRIVLDPDQEVQGAVRLVFEVFRQTGSAYAVVHHFGRQQLRFPKRAYGGAWDGRLIWGRLNHNRVLDILKNPTYAGAYVFGRHQSTKEVSPEGDVRMRTRRVPLDAWLGRQGARGTNRSVSKTGAGAGAPGGGDQADGDPRVAGTAAPRATRTAIEQLRMALKVAHLGDDAPRDERVQAWTHDTRALLDAAPRVVVHVARPVAVTHDTRALLDAAPDGHGSGCGRRCACSATRKCPTVSLTKSVCIEPRTTLLATAARLLVLITSSAPAVRRDKVVNLTAEAAIERLNWGHGFAAHWGHAFGRSVPLHFTVTA